MNFHGPYTLRRTPSWPRHRCSAHSANGSIPALTLCRDNGAQSGYGLMNQPCQRFSGGPRSSRTPSTTFVHVVFLLDLGSVRGYERGGYTTVTDDRRTRRDRSQPRGAQSRSTGCPVSASTRLIASDGQEAAASRTSSSGSISASTGPDRCRSSRTNRSAVIATHIPDPMHKSLSTEIFQRLMIRPTGPEAHAGCGSPFPV